MPPLLRGDKKIYPEFKSQGMRGVRQDYNYFLDFQDGADDIPQGKADGTDNERCQHFQRLYLAGHDERAFVELWKLFTLLCRKMVHKEMRTKRFFLDRDEADYRADIACEYVMRRYQSYRRERGENYVVRNFIAAAYTATLHTLYHEEENDYFLSMCRELDGKPAKEAERHGAKCTEKIMRISGAMQNGPRKQKKTDKEKGQLELF